MKRLFTLILSLMLALSLQARDNGQFFKKLTGKNIAVENVEQRFAEWFSLPENTEWCEVSHSTDFSGMERIEYRQYVAGVEVENSQVLIHAKDGMVRTANGMVMELRRSPARIRRHCPIYNDGTAENKGHSLYLVNTKNGFRYAYKELSTDRSKWFYYDVETLEVIKVVSRIHRFQAENSPVKVNASTIYNGDVTLDASLADDGTTYLYDPERNIHTLNAAYFPSYEQMYNDGNLWYYFPQLDMPDNYYDADIYQISSWVKTITDMVENNELDHLTEYILDHSTYINNQPETNYFAYRITDLKIDEILVKDEEGDLFPYTPGENSDDDDDDDPGDIDWGDMDWDDDDDGNDEDDEDDDDYYWGDDDDELEIHMELLYGTEPQKVSKAVISDFMTDLSAIEVFPFTPSFGEVVNLLPREGGTLVVYLYNYEEMDTLAVIKVVPDESGHFEFTNDRITFAFDYEPCGDPTADIHWGMAKTLDFYMEKFGRNSFDDNGAPVYNLVYNILEDDFVFLSFIPLNAAAISVNDPMPMQYGLGGLKVEGIMRPVVELSVMAHEFTHNVTKCTAGLEYRGESGALNESFSDIFGIAVKKYVTNCANWYIGENVILNEELEFVSNMRDMADPKSNADGANPCPDTYEGEYWVDPNNMEDMDEGGVHKNSSVQNKWFYLLTEGGEGTNDYEFSYNVEGIGMEKALKIAYLTLTSYATMESDYAAIYMASLEAAEVLFGDNSKELQAVAAAWEAVGVADSDLTGIEQTYEMDAQDGRYFDLQGRALSELPTERGVYIINGRKVVIK